MCSRCSTCPAKRPPQRWLRRAFAFQIGVDTELFVNVEVCAHAETPVAEQELGEVLGL